MLPPDKLSFVVDVAHWNPPLPTNPKHFTWNLARLGYKVLATLWQGPLPAAKRFNPFCWTNQEPEEMEPNLWLLRYQWPMLERTAWGARINSGVYRRTIEKSVAALGFANQTYFLQFTPTHFEAALEASKTFPLIYRPIDDSSMAPIYQSRIDYWLAGEKKMLERAALIAPLGRKVYDALQGKYPHVRRISTGVDFALFSAKQPEPQDISEIPHPRFGFCGAIDRYKIDFRLVERLAELRPDWSWVYVGAIGMQDGTTFESLPHRPNLHYLGAKPQSEIPAYLQHFDVGTMPMNINDYTTGINPLKLYENYATGLPLVTTPLPFAVDEPTVYVAESPELFITQCEKALADRPEQSPKLIELAQANDWRQRAIELLEFIAETAEERSQDT